MSAYRKYYRITTGPLIEAVNEYEKINNAAVDAYKLILHEIGACEPMWHIDYRISGFSFIDTPDTGIYKRMGSGGWYPKQNSKFGKQLHNRLRAIKTAPPESLLHAIGISSKYAFLDGKFMLTTKIVYIPSEEVVAFAVVPWKDIDPTELIAYQNDKSVQSCEMDHLSWVPNEHLVEIKEWQFKKEIEEWNEYIRTKQGLS